ncbi:hypothetical protein [Pseudomonas sp. MGal98]|uniref:hypothetical protein n=1 Tax=Pseudomonas sp. MGal98 TaxID=3162460 RepID=UPI0032EF63E4
MAELKVHKVVSALPQALEADSIYLVRAGDGFDLYITNRSGTIISYKANYQPKSANLAALAGLQGSANKMFYFTAESALALADLTGFGRQLVATGDAPGARSALGLGTASTAERQRFPFPNIMPDGGRFGGKVDLTSLGLSSDFSPGNYFPPYNGASITSAGKFIHSNTADSQLTEAVQSLLTAMGRLGDDRRYGVEFYVAAVAAGQGTTVPNKGADGVTRYLLMAMQRAIASAGNYATFVSWVRVRSGSAHVISECYIDGAFYAAGKVIPAGWRHLRIVAPSAYGYFSQMPNVYAVAGSVIEFALPGYFSGEVDVGRHVIPLLGFNGVAS